MTKFVRANQKIFSKPQSFFRGAWIDDNGREIPITERMIQEACRDLESAANSVYPEKLDFHTSIQTPNHSLLNIN